MRTPPPSRRLLLALVLSLMLHVAVGTQAPAFIPSPAVEIEPEPLQARIEPPPPKPVAKVEASKPKAPRKPRRPPPRPVEHAWPPRPMAEAPPAPAEPEEAPPAAEEPPPPAQAQAPAEPPPAPEPPPPPKAEAPIAPDALPLPQQGRLVYTLYKGDQGLSVGRVVHTWQISDAGAYTISSTTEATGVFSLIKRGQILQVSKGTVVAEGFRPDTYWIQRGQSRGAGELAKFDREAKVIHFEIPAGRYDVPLAENAQDLLSFLYQFAFLKPSQGSVQLPITNGRKIDVYRIAVVGEETVEDTGGTPIRSLHLARQSAAGDTIEVWVAPERNYLPVRVRFTDRKGDRLEQVIEGAN